MGYVGFSDVYYLVIERLYQNGAIIVDIPLTVYRDVHDAIHDIHQRFPNAVELTNDRYFDYSQSIEYFIKPIELK